MGEMGVTMNDKCKKGKYTEKQTSVQILSPIVEILNYWVVMFY
jgi:hypothetical protein